MNYEEAQTYAKKFDEHAQAFLDYNSEWQIIIPTNATETPELTPEFHNTPAWEAHNTPTENETVLQEWFHTHPKYSSNVPLLIVAKLYNFEHAQDEHYNILYQKYAVEQKLPSPNQLKHQITTLERSLKYESKRAQIHYKAYLDTKLAFADEYHQLEEYFTENH